MHNGIEYHKQSNIRCQNLIYQLMIFSYNQRIMQKARKDKGKKNAEGIPLVATQNTNLFSQLSAQYLQSKALVTEQQKKFIDDTEVIQYHDPEINRILQRLRKKDQTTKIKAILQLKQAILKMEEEDIANFSTTFCYLFRALVLNQESKKVQIELHVILQHILKNFKKHVLPNIAILFPALLIFQKANRCNLFNLLFIGHQSTHLEKALTLIEKTEVAKQFVIIAKIIIDKHDKDKLQHSLLLNNCTGLLKSFKQFILLKVQKQKIEEWTENWNYLYNQIKDLLVCEGALQFLKQNTKAKAAILQIYLIYVEIAVTNNKSLDKMQEQMLKWNKNNFLEKDQVIQNSMWKYSNTKLLQVLFSLDRLKDIEEIESKFLSVLEMGGEEMFKQLKNFIKLLPIFQLNLTDSTKFLNTLTFIKKTNQILLNIQQFNEQRIKCYQDINIYFLQLYHKAKPQLQTIKADQKQQKRWEQCKKALLKAERSIVQNLEQLYYKYPPASKNSFTYYIPPTFSNLIRLIQVLPRSNINIPLTYHLYSEIASDTKFQPFVDQIFHSRTTLDELLEYFENFPSRPVQIDMTSGNNLTQIYKKCRIYQLTIEHQAPNWFTWGTHFNFFMFDPMLEVKHIALIDANESIQFNKKLNIEKMDKFIPQKLKYMEQLLTESSPQSKYYIPSYLRYVNKSQSFDINSLIKICNQYREKLTVPNTYIIKTIQHIYNIIIEYLKTRKNELQNISLDLFSFVLYLYDKNMDSDAYSLLQKSFELRDTAYFKSIIEGINKNISQKVQNYVNSGEIVEEKKQRVLKKKVDKLVILINKVLDLLTKINFKPQGLVRQFLKEQYFKYALYRPQIWILFHSMATQLAPFEIQSIIKDLIEERNNYILGLLICVNSIYPLQTNLELKKFYQTIYTTYIGPRVIDLFENGDQKGFVLISKMLEMCDKSLIFAVGIKNLIKQSITEQIPQANIEKLFDITILYLFNKLDDKNQNQMRKSIAIQAILPQFSSLMHKHINIFQKSLEKVQTIAKESSLQKTQFEVYLDVVTIFWQQKINNNLIFEIDIQSIIGYLFASINKELTTINFQLQVLLNFMNVIIENKTLQPFSEHLLDIEKFVGVLMQHNKQKSPEFMNNALIKLCQFLRKILPIIEAFSPAFKDDLLNRVVDLCILKVRQFENVAEDIDSGVVDENIDSIVLELSELINRFTLVPSIKGREEDIIELLSTRFASLQKSAFIYLRHYYQTGNNTKDSALYLLKKCLTGQTTEDISTVFSQTLLWILLFVRKMNFNTENEQFQQFVLAFENEQSSFNYLNFAFKTIDHLGYDQTQEEFYCDVTEVTEVSLDWSNYMSQRELFKLLIQSLFIFSSNFPMDLRLWYDRQKDKKQQSLCQKVLKNIISDALFSKQIEKIELRQSEWKSEQFDVYALKKSKEICAEYANNGAKISLKLKIKDNYPLSPITIEFGNELKIEQKLNKWILKLKSLLYNQNNSICSGIILWKQNIDKQFQGIDECAICYDIVNNQKQLPKMVCKTCKKKFHSACIRKWFQTSNKSQCPLCKSQFL